MIHSSRPPNGPTAQRRLATYYFIQAMSVGAINGFAGIWLASRGITESEIGVIFAVPIALVVLLNVWVGRLADRANDWRDVIVVGALASAVAPLGLLLADGFWGILLVWSLAVVTQVVILPVTDAASMRLARRTGADFGRLYAWKTVGYLTVIVLSGVLLSRIGVAAFLPVFLGLSIARGLASLMLPKFRAEGAVGVRGRPTGRLFAAMGMGFTLPLIGWGMVHCTHSVLNGFLGLLWHQQGLSTSTIGLLIGVSGLAETAMFLSYKRFFSHLPAHTLVLFSCLCGVLRWGAFAFSPPVEVLFLLQLLHAATYALGFLACTNFIADRASEEVAAEAQSVFSVVQSGLAILALLGFGWLSEQLGEQAFLVSAAFAATGAGLVVVAARFQVWRESASDRSAVVSNDEDDG